MSATSLFEMLEVNAQIAIPESELKWSFTGSGGPGGQHANTSNTKVILSFDVRNSPAIPDKLRERAIERFGDRLVDGVLTIVSTHTRSQTQNRLDAERRLAEELRIAIAPPPRKRLRTRVPRSQVKKRAEDNKRNSLKKQLRKPPGSLSD